MLLTLSYKKKDRTVTFIENAKVNIPNEIYGGNSTNAISSRSYHKIEVVLDDSIKPDSQQTNLVSGNFGDFESQFKFSILSDRMSLSIMTNGQDGDSSFTLKLSGKTYLAKE